MTKTNKPRTEQPASHDVSLLKPGYRKAETRGDASVFPLQAEHTDAAAAFRGEDMGGDNEALTGAIPGSTGTSTGAGVSAGSGTNAGGSTA